MTSNIAKKRYPQPHKQTDFFKYCSPSAAALGEENSEYYVYEAIVLNQIAINWVNIVSQIFKKSGILMVLLYRPHPLQMKRM